MSDGGVDKSQVELQQQMVAALEAMVTQIEKVTSALGGQAGAAAKVTEATKAASDAQKSQSDASKDLTESIKENTGGSDALSDSLGRSSKASQEAGGAFGKLGTQAGAATAILGSMSAISSGVGEAFAATQGALNLFTGGLQGMMGIAMGALGVVGGLFKGLFAAATAGGGGGELFKANQAIVASFGDLHGTTGKAVKGMAKELGTYKKAMKGAGTSARKTLGNMAAILGEVMKIAEEFGDSFVYLQDQVTGAVSEMMLMRKGMNVSGEAMKQLASSANAAGGSVKDSLTDAMVASAHLSNQFGIDVKDIGKRFSEMAEDVENFGHLGPKALAATAAYATKLGVSVKSLQGIMGGFDTFEDAAANAGKLSEAFGMNIDVMGMMNAENPAERMDMLRKSFEETGKSVNDLSRHELKMLSDSMGGMPIDELKNSLSMSTDEMGFGDFEDAAEEAASKMTPEEAMEKVAKSIDKLSGGMSKMTAGPFSEFIRGFKRAVEKSKPFRKLMKQIRKWLKEFYKLGVDVGNMFVDTFLTKGNKVGDTLTNIFDLKRIKEFATTVKGAFKDFFALVKEDPGQAVSDLFDKVTKAVQDWFGGGPSGLSLAEGLQSLLITALEMVGAVAPKIISIAAKYIRKFAVALKEFLAGDNATANAMGEGIGGAFMEAFNAIKDAVINDLGPAMLDLFSVLFEKFGPPLIAILGAIWTAIFIKSIVSAALAAAAGAAVKVGIQVLANKLSGMANPAGQTGGQAKNSQQAAKSTKTLAEGMGDMLEAFRKIEKKDVKRAGMILFEMAKHLVKGMVVFAIGMVIVSAILSVVPWSALAKGIIGLSFAVMNSIPMIGAAVALDKLKANYKKIGIDLMKLALVWTVGGVALALGAVVFAAAWSMVPVGPMLKGILLMTLIVMSMIPVIIVAAIMGAIAQYAMPIVVPGLIGLGVMMVVMSLLGLAAIPFSMAWSKVPVVDTLKGIFLLNMLVLGMIPTLLTALILGAILTGPAALAMVVGFVALGLLMVGLGKVAPDLAASATGLATAFKTVKIAEFLKAVTVINGMALLTAGLVAIGLILAVSVPFMGYALIGLLAAEKFLMASSEIISDAVGHLLKIKIPNPDKTLKVITIIGKVVKIIAQLADLGLKAGKMAIVGSLFGGGKPADMMTSMSSFVTDIIGSISSLITNMVDMAGKFDEKALKGAEAIANIIGAIAGLAGALLEPLTKMSENSGWTAGNDFSSMMKSAGKAIGDILGALKSHLTGPEGIIQLLISSLDGVSETPEAIKTKAETLKMLFEALVAMVTAMGKIQEFEKPDTAWFSDNSETALDVITKIFGTVRDILKLPVLGEVVTAAVGLVSNIGNPDGVKKGAEALGTLINGMINWISGLSKFGTFLTREGGAQGLLDMKTAMGWMESGKYLPHQVMNLILDEAKMIGKGLKKMDITFPKVNLRPNVEAVMGFKGSKRITVAPEGVTMNVTFNVSMNAEQLAKCIRKGNKKHDGFFKLTDKAINNGMERY